MKRITTIGDSYQIGYQIGKHFSSYLQSEVKFYQQAILVKEIQEKIDHIIKITKENYYDCYQEIMGRAEGAQIDYKILFLMYSPEIFKKADGCTTIFLKKPDGNFIFSHNEDDKDYSDNNVALIRQEYADHWIEGYTVAKKLVGSCFSWNSYGLVFSSNFIASNRYNYDNISRYIAVREIIDSKSLKEAIERLKSLKVCSPFSLNILDTINNVAVNVEKDIDETYIYFIDDKYARSNHFVIKKDENIPRTQSSQFRYEKANELLNKLEGYDIKSILDYQQDDIDQCIYKDYRKFPNRSITVANMTYDNTNKIIRINDYLTNEIINIKYEHN